MPTVLGAHNARIAAARELLTKKGRKQQGRFAFEGPTLLQDAIDAGVAIDAIYATNAAYESCAQAKVLEANGVPVFVVDERAMQRISAVETPSGLLAIAPVRFTPLAEIVAGRGAVLLLADVSDPGNAGTLLRTAEAFGVAGVIAGSIGAEPHLPKVVRSAMGALFRVPLAVADPADVAPLVRDMQVTGLSANAPPIGGLSWAASPVVVVGNERHGLGRWEPLCTRQASIPMREKAESLNAAVAGSIALYEATKPSIT